MQNVLVWHNDVGVALNFHIFEVHDFDILIGQPIEKMFLDVLTLGTLDITLGGKAYSIPMNSKAEKYPKKS